MKFQTYKIEKEFKNIYYFLKANGFSENFISNLRKDWGNFVVNEEIVNIKKGLRPGDILQINNNPNKKTSIMQCIIPLDIVFEDKYYLLVNKPSGIPCMQTRSHYSNNMAGAICNYMSTKEEDFVLRIINRLDKDTAGIIIVAKDSISQNKIQNIEKIYHAVCCGQVEKDITINSPIKTVVINGKNQHKRIIAPDGKDATTLVSPIKTNNNLSLVSAKLIHGRTHQIRLHLSSIGHPLIGDTLYGEKSNIISHTALICKQVSFFHPYENKVLNFEIDYPESFKHLLKSTKLL